MSPRPAIAPAPPGPDVVIVGAGIVGAACAYLLARAGLRVRVLERAFAGAGTSGACEGNVLAWDKELERELPFALRSAALWEDLAQELADPFEYDRKGSLVIAETPEQLAAAARRATRLEALGVPGHVLDADALRTQEPACAPDLPGGVLHPGDAQLEPRLATGALLAGARRHGATLTEGTRVLRLLRGADGRALGIETAAGRVPAGAVVVAAGVWTPAVLRTAGLDVPIRPRKGQIVVTERSPVSFRRKLSEAAYVSAVASDADGLRVAMVVESTASGTTLLGSSRQHAGFDREVDLAVSAAIARRAARFFPVLRQARAIRMYAGLRPFSPDHLPVVGPLPDAPNVLVATGHEGAGVGLAPATAELVAAALTGAAPPVPPAWLSPARFAAVPAADAVARA